MPAQLTMEDMPDLMLSIGLMHDGTFLGVVHRNEDGDIIVAATAQGSSQEELIEWFKRMIKDRPWQSVH